MNAWLWLFLSLLLVFSPPRAVTFMDFHAEGRSGSIEVFWETGSESNNVGFNLHRATSEAGPFTKITFMPSQGDTITGHSYQFTDTNVEPGIRYYYKLEAIDRDTRSQWHDVIASAVALPSATPTPTSTSTPTATVTPAPTSSGSPTPYAPATAPGGATATPTSVPSVTASPTATSTGTPIATGSPTPSATPPAASVTPPRPTATRPPGATAAPTKPPLPTPSATGMPSPAGPTPAPVATETSAPTAPGPSPTPTPTPPGPGQTAFPTVPPQQPPSLSNICVQSLSYAWLIVGMAVLLVLVVGFVVLMGRGRRGEP